MLGKFHPDFSQIEDVVEPISFSYTERYLPDLRPFFATGEAGYLPPDELLYTRRIEDFDAGVKLFGTLGKDTVGFLDVPTAGEENALARGPAGTRSRRASRRRYSSSPISRSRPSPTPSAAG